MAAVRENEEERIRQLEELTPELPKNFKEWCGEKFKTPEIYYKRKGSQMTAFNPFECNKLHPSPIYKEVIILFYLLAGGQIFEVPSY